ncbi:carboxypeptidase Q-like isoform X1 [Amphibalanus amphitrite]|uniref:carboxypeptidase Q-like isoform X1 n=1 Tax=Amphibalanus amphitrite TaxID=1232801 RepID=UPI001C90A6E7|nr:carboxypeptidase Q-like isoform X1 [Amphibalanus amphitrite]
MEARWWPLALIAALAALARVDAANPVLAIPEDCPLPETTRNNILRYKTKVDKILQAALEQKQYHHAAYNGLEDFVERFGARPSGSDELEDSIDFMKKKAEDDGFRVHTEEVMVPRWVRGEETLMMLSPRQKSMSILGLGTTIGTQQYPGGVLRAEAVVCDSFEEMEKLGEAKIKGKIMVFNAPFGDPMDEPMKRYGASYKYRTSGADRAAQYGAVAVLVRSRTDYSLYTPHGGSQYYGNSTQIPAAAITAEDARIIARHYKKGKTVKLMLKMSAANLPMRKSRNVIIDYGPSDSTELVMLSAHIDSWDVGEGAMDNGGGVFVNYHAVKLLKELGLMPRRTIRVVLWTAEEEGYFGGKEYVKMHEFDISKMQIAIENDLGTFRPVGLRAKGSDEAACFVKHTASLLGAINATGASDSPSLSETHLLHDKGVPAAAIDVDQSRYFWYHHTEADTMDALDPHELDLCVATMAASAFVFADVPDRVPSQVPAEPLMELNTVVPVEQNSRALRGSSACQQASLWLLMSLAALVTPFARGAPAS